MIAQFVLLTHLACLTIIIIIPLTQTSIHLFALYHIYTLVFLHKNYIIFSMLHALLHIKNMHISNLSPSLKVLL